MSFEIKYDKDRNPIANPNLHAQAHADTTKEAIEDVVTADIEQDASQETQENNQDEPSTPAKEDPIIKEPEKEIVRESFRELRLRKEQAERERDELLRLLKEREALAKPKELEEDNEVNLGNDDLVEGKHLSKVGKQIKKLQQELLAYKQQTAEQLMERKLKETYQDFDKIVSRENIEALREQFPEIANTLHTSSSDLYSKAVSTYTMIKKLGIAKEPEPYSEEKEKLKANTAKPRPLASISPLKAESPLSHANAFAKGLTKELQEQLRKEMEEARRMM